MSLERDKCHALANGIPLLIMKRVFKQIANRMLILAAESAAWRMYMPTLLMHDRGEAHYFHLSLLVLMVSVL